MPPHHLSIPGEKTLVSDQIIVRAGYIVWRPFQGPRVLHFQNRSLYSQFLANGDQKIDAQSGILAGYRDFGMVNKLQL